MYSEVKDIIKSHGMKATPQRIHIYNILRKHGHTTADMIYSDVKQEFPTLSFATVYNVLQTFVESGIVRPLYSTDSKMYFDITTTPHYHIYDESTRTFQDIKDDELLLTVKNYLASKGMEEYDIDSIKIQLIRKTTDK
ncbi:MAG: transcriptional repressor [Bacteroidales bacterium]|nr:transcriptional repressor [Bacteroidales bacterium]